MVLIYLVGLLFVLVCWQSVLVALSVDWGRLFCFSEFILVQVLVYGLLLFIIGFGVWENKGVEYSSVVKSFEIMCFNIEFVFWEGGVLNNIVCYFINMQ